VNTDSANLTDDDFAIEIYDHGRHVVTMSAKYQIGDTKTAYDRALKEMKAAGYVEPVGSSGTGIDRSRQDIAVVRFLRRRCVQRTTIKAVLFQGSDKASERGTTYVDRTIDAVFKQR
jgi:hypothetical protein